LSERAPNRLPGFTAEETNYLRVIIENLAGRDPVALMLAHRIRDVCRVAASALTPSDVDRADVEALLNEKRSTWFGARLVRMLSYADGHQTEVLRLVYPEHVAIFQAWQRGESGYKPPAGRCDYCGVLPDRIHAPGCPGVVDRAPAE
jgi:hypothetical protein